MCKGEVLGEENWGCEGRWGCEREGWGAVLGSCQTLTANLRATNLLQ